jgi:hypothetical protein
MDWQGFVFTRLTQACKFSIIYVESKKYEDQY